MKKVQDQIKKFNDDRDWSNLGQLKDLLLNMSEEVGEMWQVIAWVDERKQKLAINKNREEVENFIGDMIFLILKVSYITGVDPDKAIKDVLAEYEQRFPVDKVKGSHSNIKVGGVDFKKQLS